MPLRRVGCVGRLTAYQELDDGRLLITLTGIARFELVERDRRAPSPTAAWRSPTTASRATSRPAPARTTSTVRRCCKALKTYLEARNLKVDWAAVSRSSTEQLVNSLSIVSPYGPEEKQALLEAPDLKSRAEMLIALAEMELAAGSGTGGSGSTLQ